MHSFFKGIWTCEHIRNNVVIYKEEKKNMLVDEGEQNILNTYFRNYSAPSGFYVGLGFGTVTETMTLASLVAAGIELPVLYGYSRQAILRDTSADGWPTIAQDANGDYKITSKQVSWTASAGSIGPTNVAFLCTAASGTSGMLLTAVALSAQRTILSGDIFRYTYNITLQ